MMFGITAENGLHFIQNSSHLIIFIAMALEGPIVTAAAAFLASLGYFDVMTILVLSLCANTLADIVYYSIGRVSHKALLHHWMDRKEKRRFYNDIIEHIHDHPVRTIVAIKLTPIIPMVGLMAIGASRIPARRFIPVVLVANGLLASIYTIAGFFSGRIILESFHYFGWVGASIALIIITTLIYGIYRRWRKRHPAP